MIFKSQIGKIDVDDEKRCQQVKTFQKRKWLKWKFEGASHIIILVHFQGSSSLFYVVLGALKVMKYKLRVKNWKKNWQVWSWPLSCDCYYIKTKGSISKIQTVCENIEFLLSKYTKHNLKCKKSIFLKILTRTTPLKHRHPTKSCKMNISLLNYYYWLNTVSIFMIVLIIWLEYVVVYKFAIVIWINSLLYVSNKKTWKFCPNFCYILWFSAYTNRIVTPEIPTGPYVFLCFIL